MNNIIFAPTPSRLIRTWRSTGEPGTPLVCKWVQVEPTTLRSGSTTDVIGGLLRCA
jgi:hypothetical protein